MLSKQLSQIAVALGCACLIASAPGCKKDKDDGAKKEPQRTTKAKPVDAAVKDTVPKAPAKLSGAQVVALMDGVSAVLNPLKPAKLAGFYSDNASYVVKSNAKTVTGNGKIAGYYRDFMAAFPDMKIDQLLLLVNDQRAVLVYRSRGTNSKPMMGLKATNKKTDFIGFEHLDFADGRIDRVEAYADNLSFLGQMGVYKGGHRKYSGKDSPARIVALAKQTDAERENLGLATKMKDYFNAKDMTAHAAMYAREAVVHDATLTADQAGLKPIRAAIGAFRKAFPDATISDFKAWSAGDYVTATYRLTGTHNGRYARLKLAKTGKRIGVDVATVLKINKGKIERQWVFADAAALAHQLGALKLKM